MKALEIIWTKPIDKLCIFPRGGVPFVTGFSSIEGGLREQSFESDVLTVGSVKHNLSRIECDKAFTSFAMWHFLKKLWVNLQCVISAFPDRPGCAHVRFPSIQFLEVVKKE